MPMSESHENAVSVGFGIFEIRSFIGQYKTRSHQNYFNIKVKVDSSSANQRPIVTWLTGNEAIATMESDKRGVGIMYMPDDPWGHNRMMFLNLPRGYEIVALHTKTGSIPGSVIKEQIEALRRKAMEPTTIYRILENGIAISDRTSEEDAQREIDTLNEMVVKVDKRTGQQKVVSLKNAKYEVIKVESLDYTKEIKALVKKYRGLQYGWTACEEFQKILKEIKEEAGAVEMQTAEPMDPKQVLKEMFSGMTASEKAAMLASLLKGEEEKPAAPKGKAAKKEIEAQ